MPPIDLHTHSDRSDGTCSPEALVRYARAKGLSAIALTDHDTIDGVREALDAAAKLKEEDPGPVPEVIPGVELSTEYGGRDIHILGLYIDWQDRALFLLRSGGVPVLAHPLQYKMSDAELRELVLVLTGLGLSGIEVYYPGHSSSDTAYLCRIADQYGLLYSGGSDFHGSRKENLDLGTGYGHLYVPYTILPPIREKAMSLKEKRCIL